MTSNEIVATLTELQARIADLMTANERLRDERDAARSSVDLLMHDNHDLTTQLEAMRADYSNAMQTVGRLRLHLQQGIEL